MGEIGCYDMHLYCDNPVDDHGYREMPHQFTGPDRGYCLKQARKSGWLVSPFRFNKDHTRFCLCPKHSGKKPNRS